jgi:hypothetical protein
MTAGCYVEATDHAPAPAGYRASLRRAGSWMTFCALLIVQGYLALQLFGPDNAWSALADDAPITDGRHPLHYYHSTLSAQAWQRSRAVVCYDPLFQAGYPKTPVFDGGGRPLELAALFVGGQMKPHIYKLAVWVTLSLLPILLWLAAASLGLGRCPCLLAFALAILVLWNDPARRLLESGDVNALTLGGHTVLYLALLTRYHLKPGPIAWLGMLATSAAGWYLNPSVWAGLIVLSTGFWMGVRRRHDGAWHIGFLLAQLGAGAIMSEWVFDWARYWWIHLPIRPIAPAAPCRDWWDLWESPPWGGGLLDRVAFALFVLTGLVGSLGRLATLGFQTGGRTLAWLFLAAAAWMTLAVAGYFWSPLRPFGNDQYLYGAICLAIVPTAQACTSLVRWVVACPYRRCGFATLMIALAVAAGVFFSRHAIEADVTAWGPRPFTLGRPTRADSFVRWAELQTRPDARIVWEDVAGSDDTWSVLLAPWSRRPFLGALGAGTDLEHGSMALRNGILAGRPMWIWSDEELECYCRRYNVGWFVCSGEMARERLSRFASAELLPSPAGWEGRSFYAIRRPHGYLLRGTARTLKMEPQRVTLTDVVPENGTVLLSLHYQHGCQVRPAWVLVEREPDPYDPIPLLRLRMPGPVARVTLTWDGR